MKTRFYIVLLLTFVLDVGQASAAAQIEQEQAKLLEAAAKSMRRDFRGAENIYTGIISSNASSIDAYLERGLIRRSMNNPEGVKADATRARTLIDAALAQNANNADLYYKRSLADRMLKDFDTAVQDLEQAVRLGKKIQIDNDYKAIEVERKMAQ